jgi:tetratricopeptide (TPR) repeat protein
MIKKLKNLGRDDEGEPINPDLVTISSLFDDGITIEAEIAAISIRMKKRISAKEILALNELIWNEYKTAVTPDDFAIAARQVRKFREIVEAEGILGETLARIFLTESRLVYYRDKKTGTKSDEAYHIAMKGLEYAGEPGTKVSLYNVASDTKAELVGDYKQGVELANKSCEIAEDGDDVDLGKAYNNAALRYLNLANRFVGSGKEDDARIAFDNAIEHFKKALEAHERAGNTRGQGHAYNNMILCYQGLAGLASIFSVFGRMDMYNKALEQAELAKKAYGDNPENAIHVLSANYRRGQTYELMASITGTPQYLFSAIQCYAENLARALELGKTAKARKELGNIQKITVNYP